MSNLKEQTVVKIAKAIMRIDYWSSKTNDEELWKQQPDFKQLLYIDEANFLLKQVPELAIVNRNKLIDFAKYDILVEQAKEIMNDGWVKEVKE